MTSPCFGKLFSSRIESWKLRHDDLYVASGRRPYDKSNKSNFMIQLVVVKRNRVDTESDAVTLTAHVKSFTWQRLSSCVHLHKDRLTLQAVLHGVDADVVQLPGS